MLTTTSRKQRPARAFTHPWWQVSSYQAELAETLQGEGPFRVFAPTDQAFADAGIDLAALNTEEGKETLTDILLFHVYSGTLASTDITEGMKLRMLNGDDAMLSPTQGIEGANITSIDVQTSNGIIHIVDKVLMPPVDSETDGDSTAAGTSDEDGNLLLIVGIVLIVAIVGGLLVVRFARRGHDGLEAIQAIGKTDVGLPQTTHGCRTSHHLHFGSRQYGLSATSIPAANLRATIVSTTGLPARCSASHRSTRGRQCSLRFH